MDRFECGHCGKKEVPLWEGFDRYSGSEAAPQHDSGVFCRVCVNTTRKDAGSAQRFVPALAAMDVKIAKQQDALKFVVLKKPFNAPPLAQRTSAASVEEASHKDDEYGWRLSLEERRQTRHGVAPAFEVAGVHNYVAGSEDSRSLLSLFFAAKAQQTSEATIQEVTAAVAEAVKDGLQVMQGGTVAEAWTLVCALKAVLYSTLSPADDAAATERLQHGGEVGASADDHIRAAPIFLTITAQENALFWGVVIHFFCHRHWVLVQRLLSAADGPQQPGGPSREATVEALSGLLVSGAHAMIIAAHRQRNRHIVHQQEFWDAFALDGAVKAKYAALNELRASWTATPTSRRAQSLSAYVDGLKECLCVYLASIRKNEAAFNRSFDQEGQGRAIEAARPEAAPAGTSAGKEDPMGDYMEGLRIAKSFILYQPFYFQGVKGEPYSQTDTFLRGDLWARMGCLQLLDTINRFLFRSAPTADGGGDKGITSAAAWQLMATAVKQFCLSTPPYQAGKVRIGTVLATVLRLTREEEERALDPHLNFDFGRNRDKDVTVSRQLLELLKKRGEAFLQSGLYDAAAAVKDFPFQLTKFLCGKMTAGHTGEEEVMRPCCDAHQRQRGASVSADFMSCSRCLLKVFFPGVTAPELNELGKLDYHLLDLKLKPVLSLAVNYFTDKVLAVEEHIQHVTELAFTATTAEDYKRRAESYLQGCNLLRQSLAVVEPYVKKMYDKLSNAKAVKKLVAVGDGSFACIWKDTHVKLSQVMAVVRGRQEKVRYIQVYADFTLDIDCDVRLPGVSLLLDSFQIRLNGSHTFDMSGADATTRGKNGAKGRDGNRVSRDGEDGEMGHSGLPGCDGGNICVRHETPLKAVGTGTEACVLTLRSKGGVGGAGGNGGAGGDGYTAANLPDATLEMFIGATNCGGHHCQYSMEPLRNDELPGRAGQGGGLGSGGIGGRRGEISAAPTNVDPGVAIVVAGDSVNGSSGPAGKPGRPGVRGGGGRDGQALDLTYAFHYLHKDELIECESYYALADKKEYYDGFYSVRGREQGSTGSTKRTLSGGRAMYCNYTWGRFVCLRKAYITQAELGAREFVSGGVVRSFDDFDNTSSTAVSNPVEQAEQRLSFEEVQEKLGGALEGLAVTHGADRRECDLNAGALLANVLAAEAHGEAVVLDNLFSMTLGEAIVAMERSSSFEESLKQTEYERVQAKAQVMMRFRAASGASDGVEGYFGDGYPIRAPRSTQGGVTVPELDAIGPLYELAGVIDELNAAVVHTQRSEKHFSLYLRLLMNVVGVIENKFAENAFVLTYVDIFYSKSLFQIETELFRVGEPCLLSLVQPSPDKLPQLPAELERSVYRALTYRYMVTMAGQLASTASERPSLAAPSAASAPHNPPAKAPTARGPPLSGRPARAPRVPQAPRLDVPPPIPADHGSQLARVRVCAERLRYCAAAQVRPALKEAKVAMAVCPLFALSALPDFAVKWPRTLRLAEMLFRTPIDGARSLLPMYADDAVEEFRRWVAQLPSDPKGVDSLAHPLARRTLDWLRLSPTRLTNLLSRSFIEAHIRIVLDAPGRCPGLSALRILSNWKEVIEDGEFLPLFCRAASHRELDEWDPRNLPDDVREVFSVLLAYTHERRLFDRECQRDSSVVWRYDTPSANFLVKTLVLLLKLHVVQRGMEARFNLFASEAPTGECFCTTAKRENWTITDALESVEQIGDLENCAFSWRVPCWECLPFAEQLRDAGPEEHLISMPKYRRLTSCIKQGNSVSLESLLQTRTPRVVSAVLHGWAQLDPSSEAGAIAAWMASLHCCVAEAGAAAVDGARLPDAIWTELQYAPPSMQVLVGVLDATRWNHAPFRFDLSVLAECSCFPIRKHAAHRLTEVATGPYATRLRTMLDKVYDIVGDAKLDALLHPLLDSPDLEHILRVLCQHYLEHWAKKIFGAGDYTSLLKQPILSLTRYACVEAVLVVVDAFAKQFSDPRNTARVYPEYLNGALQALEGLHMTDEVATALTGLEVSGWMTALQRRRFYQCIHLWWLSRNVKFPSHEMYHWMLHVGENNFQRFMHATRSLSNNAVNSVLRDFLAVPSPQRGALGKLRDALSGSGITTARVREYKRAWDDKRRQVVDALRYSDTARVEAHARTWERSWEDILTFVKEEGVAISAELLDFCRDVHEELQRVVAKPASARRDLIELFTVGFKANQQGAASNGGAEKVFAMEKAVLHDMGRQRCIVIAIFLGFYETRKLLPRRVQVLAVVALLQGSVLANINTSEGKTYITGCVLAFKLYCGYRVAFATSGFDLASRAMDFNNGAFHLLFGGDVRAAVEDADTVRPNDNVYRAHMVYTTEGNVSSRILRTLLDPTDERAFREWRGFAHWLVQDEADVPMVQSLTEAMYVGGPSLNARRDVLTFPALMACGANRDSTEAALYTWQQRLRPLCTSESDPILAENRFRSLWESARSVWRVANNREYVVVNDRSVPYNTETGETLYTSSWKEGLSTMVCIKERQRWEWESESSLTVDPLSVFSVFFKNRLTAVTGTAGGYATQAIYQRVYGLKPVSIPPAFFSLFDEQPPELYTTEESYYKGVESSVYRAIQNGQDVLVAVDTVAEADRMLQHVQRELTSRAAATRNIVFQRYAREKMDEVPCLTSGRRHVFFMTFLGGRGLDVMPQRNQLNGIHVILCSAQHERATHQVLRRAARQYHPGSGQIICFQNSPQSSDDYLKYAVDKREEFYKHQNKVMERERRRLQVLAAKEIPQALLRQELQQIVQDCVAELRVKGDQYLFVSYVVQHSFAAWLEKHEAVISTRGEEVGCREQLLKSLRRDVTDRFARTSLPDIAALARFARTTDERVILANLLRSTVVDLPWCSDGAFALFAAVKDGTCPYGIPEIVHALAAAQAADVPRVRQHVRSFLDVLGQWVASLEQFTADLQDLHTEVGGSAGNGGEAGGDVLYINASVSYLGRLREHYQTLVGTDGALVLAMFQQNGLSFAETVTTVEALVRNGFVDDAQASTTPATWMAGLKSHKGELPSLTERKMPPPSSSLAALQYCCQEGVDMREADLLFAGKVPLLAPLRLSPALFDDHARTYMEKLKATSIPHAELTCGILLSCAGLLRRGQVHRLLIVSAYAKFKDVADTEIIYDWTSLGYQHVVDVEQRTSTATNESARDEENWRRAAANAFWGLVEMGRTFGSAAVTAVSVSCLVNRLFPRTRALFTSSVVPFIKKGVVAAERWLGGDRLHEAGMLTQCIEGMANVFAASSINKVAAYLKETFGSSSVLQRVGALCSSAKDTVQRSLQQAKGIFSVNVYFALHPADFFRQVLRRSKLFFLRLVMKLAIPEVRRVSTTDFDNNIDATIRKRLRTPLLEIVATVRRQKPAHVTRFLNGALPHLQRATGQEDLSEYLLGVNSAVETFDKALRATGTDSVKETAALMLRLWDSTTFVHAARTEPQQIVEETCDAYVARCWSFAEEAHGLHRSCAESSDAADVDAVESMFVSHCEQLLRKRVVTPLRSALQRITNAFARSIHAAVDRVEAGTTTRSVQTPQGDFENEEDPSAVAPANDAVRFTLRNSLLHDGPSNGVTLSYYMRSDFGTKVSSAIGSAHAQTSSEVARRGGGTGTAVGFLNNALGRRIFGAGLGLVVSDKALVGQLMRLASGNTFIPAVRLTTNPTTAETVLMIGLVLYDRINVRRRLQSTTFVDGVFEIAIAVVSEIKAAERRFQREKGRLALAFGPFSHLRPLFQKAVAYASLAYEKERWSAAVMYVEGTAQSFPTYQIYLDAPSELVVVAFRGSTTWRDFVSDALCLPVQFCGVDAHRGFAMMTNSFFNNAVAMGVLQRLVTDNPTYRVLLTGHSLGGSLAVLSGVRLLHEKRLGKNLQARLFVVAVAGAPATTHQFAETDNFFNVVNQMDVVPRVQLNSIDRLLHVLFASFAPLITVMAEFRHPTNTFLFSADDEIKLVSGEIASNIYCSYRMLGDHSCAKYVAAFSAQKTED